MMAKSPPSLEKIALSALVREEWKVSKLPPLYATFVYNHLGREFGSTFDSPLTEDFCRECDIIMKLKNIIKKWSDNKEIPLKLKIKWAFQWEILHQKIIEFSFKMVSKEITEMELTDSVKKIIIDQNGDINKKATLLFILEDLSLVKLPSSTLTEYGVTKEEVKSIAQKLVNQLRDSPFKLRMAKSKEIMKNLLFFLKYWTSENPFLSNWEVMYEARCLVEKDIRCLHANRLQIAGSGKIWPAILHYYKKIPDSKKQENLIKLAKFELIFVRINVDMIVFLYENMETDLFIKHVLKPALHHVFTSLFRSPQYLYLCVDFFKAVIPFIKPRLFKTLFWLAVHNIDLTDKSFLCKDFHRIETYNVLKTTWTFAPAHLKNDEDFVYEMIATITVSNCNFENMLFFMERFNKEQQRIILAHVKIYLVKNNKDRKMRECDLAASRIGINIDDQQPILSKENLKKYIKNANLLYLEMMDIESIETVFKEQNSFNKIMKYVCKTDEAIEELREELIYDRAFITEIVQKCLCFSRISIFLVWLIQGKTKNGQEFFDSVTTQIWFQEDCVQKFLDNSYEREYLLQLFMIKKVDKQLMKKYPDMLYKVLQCFFGCDPTRGNDLIENIYMKYVPGPKQKFFKNFFSSTEGKQAILDLFLNIFEVEEDPSIRTPISEVVRHFMEPIKIHIKKFKSVEMQVKAWLTEYGHPNNDPKNVIRHGKERIEVSPEDLPMARRIVDAYYRIFRCLLQSDQVMTQKLYMADLTEFSIELANSLGLNIPVVH